jgi:hypothetical protein
MTDFEQYFKLRVRNFSTVSNSWGFGATIPDAFTKSPSDGWTTTDKINYWQDISYHKCTFEDNVGFYPPNENFVNTIQTIFPHMYCVDNLDLIKIYGNFNTDNT